MGQHETLLREIFERSVLLKENLIVRRTTSDEAVQEQTTQAFSEKWTKADETGVWNEEGIAFQKHWYLSLYGFETEAVLAEYLQKQRVIVDAGCGLGYKAAWFAELAPNSLVVGMDFSEAAHIAAAKYKHQANLYFVRGDIADTGFMDGAIDYVSCDQVIHHTENPRKTFAHLSQKTSPGGEFCCYVYAKKALPRELIDEYFRDAVHGFSHEQIWELSRQLTELGKKLSELDVYFESPDIPLLGIKGGKYDVQRFVYWNFLKIFWNEKLGYEYSLSTNFDWFAPSKADRYTADEYRKIISENNLEIIYFHTEEACHSGRFRRPG